MYRMLQHKHRQSDAFRRALCQTGSSAIRQDTPDRYWGIGTDGRGHNRMGILLEAVRQSEPTEDRQNDRPKKPTVAIFGSSLIKNMEAERFSRSFQTDIQLSYTIPGAKRDVKEYKGKADVVVYQLLSNDIKTKSVNKCIAELKELVELTKELQPKAKIIVSLPLNRSDNKEFNNKTNSVNAVVKTEFQDSEGVFVSDNSNLAYRGVPHKKMISEWDGIHPTELGEKVLFKNIKGAVEEACKY